MSLELVYNATIEKRLIRMQADALALSRLTPAQVRPVYDKLEVVRDALSRILDRADGKDA